MSRYLKKTNRGLVALMLFLLAGAAGAQDEQQFTDECRKRIETLGKAIKVHQTGDLARAPKTLDSFWENRLKAFGPKSEKIACPKSGVPYQYERKSGNLTTTVTYKPNGPGRMSKSGTEVSGYDEYSIYCVGHVHQGKDVGYTRAEGLLDSVDGPEPAPEQAERLKAWKEAEAGRQQKSKLLGFLALTVLVLGLLAVGFKLSSKK